MAAHSMIPPRDIIQAVAEESGVYVEGLRSKSRFHVVAWPRQLAYLLIRKRCKFSLQRIGREFGGRDHSTILHGLRVAQDRLEHRPEYRALHDRVAARLQALEPAE